MRFFIALISGLSVSMLPTFSYAEAPAGETTVAVKIQEVFVPVGYDDNDKVEFVVSGTLPDTCYKIDEATFKKGGRQTIIVTQSAKRYPAPNCKKIYVPFTTVIRVGMLEPGNYRITDSSSSTVAKLQVVSALHRWEIDENLYAPVEQASIEKVGIKEAELILQGQFTNTCLSLAESDVKVIESGNVLEILPVMKMRVGPNCKPTHAPFSLRVRLPELNDGPYLAHVRSLNGKALNTMFYMLNE